MGIFCHLTATEWNIGVLMFIMISKRSSILIATCIGVTLPKTNMTLEIPPFEDVFPIENGAFPMSY